MTVIETARGVLANPAVDPRDVRPLLVGAVRDFHASLPDYRPTPLVDAPALATRLGVATVVVKDESLRLGLPSFKILGASWATFRALCAHAGADPATVGGLAGLKHLVRDLPAGRGLTLVAATDGNHGRAVARMAALLGLRAHILVPRDMVPARIAAIRGEGAEVTVVDGTYDGTVARSARLADDTHLVVSDTSWEGYGTVPAWVTEGYATIAAEIAEQDPRAPTLVAVQIGVGAFAAAVVRSFVPLGARVVGVEPTMAACALESARAGRLVDIGGSLDSIMAGLNCGRPSAVAWPAVSAGVEAFVAVDGGDVEVAMRELAAVGVVSGESGAAGLAGLLSAGPELGLRPDDRILVISTEGATDPDAYRRIVGTYPEDAP